MRFAVAGLLLVMSLSACADTTQPVEDAAFAAGTVTDPPSVRVFRGVDAEFFFLFNDDPETGLLSLIRPVDLPGDFSPCAADILLDPASLQLIFTPQGTIRLLRGQDVSVSVYDRDEFNAVALTLGLCNAAATVEPIAQGTASFTWHETDESFQVIRNSSSFGWNARGTVFSLTDGTEYRFSNQYRGTRDRAGNFRHLTSNITLTPVN